MVCKYRQEGKLRSECPIQQGFASIVKLDVVNISIISCYNVLCIGTSAVSPNFIPLVWLLAAGLLSLLVFPSFIWLPATFNSV